MAGHYTVREYEDMKNSLTRLLTEERQLTAKQHRELRVLKEMLANTVKERDAVNKEMVDAKCALAPYMHDVKILEKQILEMREELNTYKVPHEDDIDPPGSSPFQYGRWTAGERIKHLKKELAEAGEMIRLLREEKKQEPSAEVKKFVMERLEELDIRFLNEVNVRINAQHMRLRKLETKQEPSAEVKKYIQEALAAEILIINNAIREWRKLTDAHELRLRDIDRHQSATIR